MNGSLRKIYRMAEVSKFGKMDQDIMGSGKMERQRVMVESFMLMVICTKVIGTMTKQKATEFIIIRTDPNMKVTGP